MSLTLLPRGSRTRRKAGARRFFGGVMAFALVAVFSTTSLPSASAASSTLKIKRASSASALLGTTKSAQQATARVKIPSTSATPLYLGFQLRSTSAANGYRAKVAIAANGKVNASFSRVQKNKETSLGAPVSLGLTVKPGEQLRLSAMATKGTPARIYLKAWTSKSAEPANWMVAAEDSASKGIPNGNDVFAWGFLSKSAKASKVDVTYSDTSVSKGSSNPGKVGTWVTASSKAPSKDAPSAAPKAPSKKSFPTASTTGPRSGSQLKRHNGDIVVTKPGTVLENLDVNGFVTVRAANVTIRNSIVRGGKPKGHAIGLITNYGHKNLVVKDTLIQPQQRSVQFDGIKGSNFTAERVHIKGGVDNIKIHGGDNVKIVDSLLEDTDYFSKDPLQRGNPTHNDNIQVLNGKNITIENNTIRGASNFAILGAAAHGAAQMKIEGNYLDGGHCTLKLQTNGKNSNKAEVRDNVFGPNRKEKSCPLVATEKVNLTQSGNQLETGSVVKPVITNY